MAKKEENEMAAATKTKVIRFDEFGGADVLKLEEIPLAEPGGDEVRIRIEAMSLNRADALFRENTYFITPEIPGSRIGMDAAGVIDATGAGVKNVKVGDRVITSIGFDVSKYGTHGETAILPAQYLIKYPEFLSPSEAASVYAPYLTAWGALNDFGRMTIGDFVLITAASSSVGVAAIQLANASGAIPIAATRGAEKKPGLLNFGAAHVIVTNQENLSERVQEITGGKGARLIFDPVVNGMLETLSEASAADGIILMYGALGASGPIGQTPATIPVLTTLGKQLRFWGFNGYALAASPERLNRGLDYIFDKFQSGELKVVIAKTFPLERYADAHRYLESNEQIGRVVVTV
jgi:NADPH:quinone reductase-like Zn-dependent oxidoreductase